MFAIMAEIKISNEIPDSWIKLTQNLTDFTPLTTRLDIENPELKIDPDTNKKIQIYSEKMIQTIKETLFPMHGI